MMTKANLSFYLDIDCHQVNHDEELVCGDVFLMKRVKEEGRTILILSDGMGSGVKANVLATLTASMAYNFTVGNYDVQKTAEIIMNTLPVCSERGVSYSTFTIIDIDDNGVIKIVEYDNPHVLTLRGGKILDLRWEKFALEGEKNRGKILRTCTFQAEVEDRMLFWSDGIMQSGIGTANQPYGWGQQGVIDFVLRSVGAIPDISSTLLAKKIVNMAVINDGGKPKDDSSCGVVYFRVPRSLLFISGPPFTEDMDEEFAERVRRFKGKRIIAGGTTSEIIARELNYKFKKEMLVLDVNQPPISQLESIDLVTEGIITLGYVSQILESYKSETKLGRSGAEQIVKLFLESDEILFLVGTCVNQAHQDPNMPIELEIRRSVIKRIANLLESKFLKEVSLEFI